MRARRILCCESHGGDPNWKWVAPALAEEPLEWEFFHRMPRGIVQRRVRTPDVALMEASWRCVGAAVGRHADLMVTHEPRTTYWCAEFARLRRVDVPHVAHAFNYCYLPTGLRHRLQRRAFERVDHFVTFSSVERELYAKHFGIPRNKIEVVLWGVRPPVAAERSPHVPEGDYVCALGGNRRDYGLLFAAIERLPDVKLVAVLRPHNLEGLRVPANVEVRCQIPIPDAMAVLKHSRFMALPLDHGVVPCGHITMVSAMHMGKAFVATDSAGIRDYAADGENCLVTRPGDVEGMARAIRELWNDRARAEKLAQNGYAFAGLHCTEEATVEHVRSLLRRMHVLPTPYVSPAAPAAAAVQKPVVPAAGVPALT